MPGAAIRASSRRCRAAPSSAWACSRRRSRSSPSPQRAPVPDRRRDRHRAVAGARLRHAASVRARLAREPGGTCPGSRPYGDGRCAGARPSWGCAVSARARPPEGVEQRAGVVVEELSVGAQASSVQWRGRAVNESVFSISSIAEERFIGCSTCARMFLRLDSGGTKETVGR